MCVWSRIKTVCTKGVAENAKCRSVMMTSYWKKLRFSLKNGESGWKDQPEGQDRKLPWDLPDHPRLMQESCSLAQHELGLPLSRGDHGECAWQAQSQGIQQTLGLILEAALQARRLCRPRILYRTKLSRTPSDAWALLSAYGLWTLLMWWPSSPPDWTVRLSVVSGPEPLLETSATAWVLHQACRKTNVY